MKASHPSQLPTRRKLKKLNKRLHAIAEAARASQVSMRDCADRLREAHAAFIRVYGVKSHSVANANPMKSGEGHTS